jgi:hypothetical protein
MEAIPQRVEHDEGVEVIRREITLELSSRR